MKYKNAAESLKDACVIPAILGGDCDIFFNFNPSIAIQWNTSLYMFLKARS